MKETLRAAKKKLNDESKPYQIYSFYLTIPIAIIVLLVLSFLGINLNTFGTILFAFTIMANIWVRKLKNVSNRKYVAPILIYVTNGLIFLFEVLSIVAVENGGTGEFYLVLDGLIVFPMEIVAIVFFFITANDIKKAYPTMKQDSINARKEYMRSKKELKESK